MTDEQKPLEILVVDDQESIRELLKECIEYAGATAVLAVDGVDAITKYDEMYDTGTPPDGVFTDLNMPNMDGIEVIRHVKKRLPETPVYVVTGDEQNALYKELLDQLGELKPDGVIGKPFVPEQIESIVEQIKLKKYSPENQSNYQTPTQP